jgi:hypothetical protein
MRNLPTTLFLEVPVVWTPMSSSFPIAPEDVVRELVGAVVFCAERLAQASGLTIVAGSAERRGR